VSSICDTPLRSARTRPRARVAVVVSGWPRLSETFALNELLALHRAGMLVSVFATKPGEPGLRHAAAVELEPLVTVLGAGTAAEQAEEVAATLTGTGLSAVHGYFAHRPAEVAAGAARLLGVPYGFSVHALDVRKVTPAELATRAAGASVVLACNADAAATVAAAGVRPRLLPHGVDLDTFRSTPPRSPTTTSAPVELLAVGRFVEKKGFATLLSAVSKIERDVHLRLVGDGALRVELVARARQLGVDQKVTFEPRRAHDALPACYANAELVVVPSVVDAAGDRDGLPNVVLEAMASGRPIVASDVGAIATGVCDGVTGRLVPPGDADALAAAITELVDRPELRRSFGARARSVAEARFALADCTAAFCSALEEIHA
jgi:glycosyltransferase involved in cell wall biosynthesis